MTAFSLGPRRDSSLPSIATRPIFYSEMCMTEEEAYAAYEAAERRLEAASDAIDALEGEPHLWSMGEQMPLDWAARRKDATAELEEARTALIEAARHANVAREKGRDHLDAAHYAMDGKIQQRFGASPRKMEVIEGGGNVVPMRSPDPEVVAALRDALEEAERGEIMSVAIVTVDLSGEDGSTRFAGGRLVSLYGAVGLAQGRIRDAIEGISYDGE